MIPYDNKDVQNFNNLLTIITSDVHKTENDVRRLIPDSKEFDIVNDINEHYHSFSIINGFYKITKTGIEIQRIGLKEYYDKLQIEQQLDFKIKELTLKELSKSKQRHRLSNIFAIVAIFISITLPLLLNTWENEKNEIQNNTNYYCKGRIELTPPNRISLTLDSTSTNEILKHIIIRHNIDSFNVNLFIEKETTKR